MATPTLSDAEFLVGYCGGCQKEVLTHTVLGPDDEEIRLCLSCDQPITAGLRSIGSEELEASGYAIVEARICGNGGGCAVGGCGMRHRD